MDLKLKKNKEVPITNLKENFHLSSSAEDLKRSDFFYLPFLESIVNTSSFSDDANGVNKVQGNLGRKLFQLGFETQFIKNEEIVSGDLLHSFSGRGAINVTLVCHADTVFEELHSSFSMSEDGEVLRGPGILDDKSGIAIILEGLRLFKMIYPNHKIKINVLSSPNEEKGSVGFEEYLKEVGKKTHFALGFEPAPQDCSLISKRSGNRWYKITTKGKSGHSGRFDEAQLSSIHEIVHKVNKILSLEDKKNLIKFNIGNISSPNRSFNVVSNEASFLLDFRFPNSEIRNRLHEKIVEIVNKSFTKCHMTGEQTESSYTIYDDCPPLENTKKRSSLLYDLGFWWGASQNLSPEFCHSGGASDLNYLSNLENISIDGLGAEGEGMHKKSEYVKFQSLISRSLRLMGLLEQIENNYGHLDCI